MKSFRKEDTTVDIIDINTGFGFCPTNNIDVSLKKLKSEMKKHEITKSLTYCLKGMYYDYSEGNEETLKACRDDKSLIPAAAFDPRKSVNYEEDIQYIVNMGFKAIRLFPEKQGWSIEQISFVKLLRIIDSFHLPIIINECPGKLHRVTNDISTPIIFLSTHYYRLYEIMAAMEDRKNFYAEARQMNSPDAIELFVKRIGAHRLIMGTGSPFEYSGSSKFMIESASITEKDKERILSLNAKEILCCG